MPKFAANISLLFKELPFLDRFAAAADHGFTGVEALFPYDDAVTQMTRRLAMNGLQMVLINCPPPNWAGGERGFAAVPGLTERFRHDFKRAVRFAEALGAQHMHVMAGKASGLVARTTFVENLRWASAEAPRMSLTIEPLNGTDMPGYFLNDFDQAAEILDEVKAKNVNLQFDMYHAQMLTGDGMAVWEAHGHRAVHVQIASAPGRRAPEKGEVDFPAFFAALDDSGYKGWVSAEYMPEGDTRKTLGWLDAVKGS
ncbi:hydroxypyruvate isomerase [Maritimibacter alkaliphilus HTCC2654]|uniref:Hydroxypyruvate isomerase, putative n=1 Tax=Maritimibacter alkaliphilus HTCC2654 TaxID=314271 RepID=A3VEX5_9RHOB|nr:TIM barrel protein [Maritimibacter alkaliphilus]EAQ13463.1 hydroxypyruvate isomerase, putative [Rhodobacterales bacterium HTCC2654] [Maritimibacter alkaliphilus HTCC2654]TYP85118.1 hydroxypyruvate isomerase [Maritimibacter alkaliphilus HTCC2654]